MTIFNGDIWRRTGSVSYNAFPSADVFGIGTAMTGLSTWWRRAGGLLAALVLTVLTFGPGLDTYICRDEGGMSAAAAEQAVAVQDETSSAEGHEKALGACVHGHCHHSAAYTAGEVELTQEQPFLGDKHAVPQVAVRSSDPKFGLMRPPRA